MAKIDIPLQQVLRLRLTPDSAPIAARVLGQDEDAWLLEVEGAPEPPREPVTLDFVASKYFLRAVTPVQGSLRRWWFVERPEEEACERVQRRSYPRIFFDGAAVVMPLAPTGEPDGELTTMQIANLSADGCFAFCDADLSPSDALSVFLTIADLPTTQVAARVVRARREQDGGWYGLRFETIPTSYQEQLARFIEDEIALNSAQGRDITSPAG